MGANRNKTAKKAKLPEIIYVPARQMRQSASGPVIVGLSPRDTFVKNYFDNQENIFEELEIAEYQLVGSSVYRAEITSIPKS